MNAMHSFQVIDNISLTAKVDVATVADCHRENERSCQFLLWMVWWEIGYWDRFCALLDQELGDSSDLLWTSWIMMLRSTDSLSMGSLFLTILTIQMNHFHSISRIHSAMRSRTMIITEENVWKRER